MSEIKNAFDALPQRQEKPKVKTLGERTLLALIAWAERNPEHCLVTPTHLCVETEALKGFVEMRADDVAAVLEAWEGMRVCSRTVLSNETIGGKQVMCHPLKIPQS